MRTTRPASASTSAPSNSIGSLLLGAPAGCRCASVDRACAEDPGAASAGDRVLPRAAACRPDFGDAYWSLANLKTYRFTDEELARLRAAECGRRHGHRRSLHLCFALGKALEDRGEFAESFRYYMRGNALKRSESKYRPDIIENNTRRQIEVCTGEFFAPRAAGVPRSRIPSSSSDCRDRARR